MSEKSRLKQRVGAWKTKAVRRADDLRYLRKENARIKEERDRVKKELRETQARLRDLEVPGRVLVIDGKMDMILLALKLFSTAHIGFRAISRVIGVLFGVLGIKKKSRALKRSLTG